MCYERVGVAQFSEYGESESGGEQADCEIPFP